MKVRWVSALVAISLVGIPPTQATETTTETTIEQMSAKLETQFALSAAPPGLRDEATVYLLDPEKGYHLSRQGTSGVTCVVERTVGPPDMKVHTMPMPHLMFYAPYVTNEDIGAVPDLSVHSSLLYPFIDKQGNAEQSYVIQLTGEAEKTRILSDEKALLDELCAWRDILCLADKAH